LDFQVGRVEGDAFTAVESPTDPRRILRIALKYGPEGEKVIQHIGRVSKPGRRIFWKTNDFKPILDGLGIAIISTSRGVMSDRQARAQHLGGEVLCKVW